MSDSKKIEGGHVMKEPVANDLEGKMGEYYKKGG